MIGGYALAFAIGLITGGRLGDIYGRKRLFVLGAIGFVIASMACAFAVSPEMLIACRLAQGGAAALLIPQGFGIIRDTFAPSEQQSAFAVFGPVIGLSAVLGPIIGGALVDANLLGSGWRLIFFVNLPLGLIAALGAARLIPESKATPTPRLDLVGTGLAALGMGLLIYPLIQGREAGWPAWTYLMVAASALSFAALVAWTRRVRRRGGDPLVEASIFSHRAYTAGISMIVVFFAGMLGTMLVLTLFMQFGMHFSAIHAGLTLAPFAAGTAVGAVLAAAVLAPRIGRTTLQIAAVIAAGGVWWLRQVILAHGLDTTSFAMVGTRAARRDRDRDDGLAAVRLHPRVGRRPRGRIRVGRPQRDAATRGGGRCRRHRHDLLQHARPRGVRDRGQPLPARRTRDDAGARAAHVHAADACPRGVRVRPRDRGDRDPDPVVPRAMVGAGETL